MTISRSQASLEFVILFGALLFLVMSMVVIVGFKNHQYLIKKRLNNVKDVALQIQSEIKFAQQASDGYYREFSLPEKINNMNYNITIDNNFLLINVEESYSYGVKIANITGTFKKGKNRIIKENGTIFINS